jgi:hypothetical protein
VRYEPVLDALAAGPETLRTLFVGDFAYPDETEMSWAVLGDASMLCLALTSLEDVTFQGAQLTLGPMSCPALRSLTLRSGGLPREPVTSIGRGWLPALERLELWLGDASYGGAVTLDDLAPILDGRTLPRLTHLGLCNAEITDELCARLVDAPVSARLRVLDLSMGTMGDDGAERLLAARDRFAALDVLDVSENNLSNAMCESLKGTFAEVRIEGQKGDRYVSVSE